jgi:WD40 repeat protein
MKFPRPKFSLRTLLILVLLIGGAGGLYMVWEPWVVVWHTDPWAQSSQFSKDGKRLLAMNRGDGVRVYDASDGKVLLQLEATNHLVDSARFSENDIIVTGTNIRRFNGTTGKLIAEEEYQYTPSTLDPETLAAGNSLKSLIQRTGHSWPSEAILSPDKRKLLVFHVEIMSLFDLNHKAVCWTKRSAPLTSTTPCFSRDGDRILGTIDFTNSSQIYDGHTGRQLVELGDPSERYGFAEPFGGFHATYSPDGQYIATSWGNGLRLWKKQRVEGWAGLAARPEFLLTIIFGIGLCWSLANDWKLWRRSASDT